MCKNVDNAMFWLFTCSLLKSNNIENLNLSFKCFGDMYVTSAASKLCVCCNKCGKTHIEIEDSSLLECYAI